MAVFAALDKVTGRVSPLEIKMGQTVTFGALKVTARACYTRPPTETPLTSAFIEVDELLLDNSSRRVFTGWTFAESPGIHAVEHPTFDVWLTSCKMPEADTSRRKTREFAKALKRLFEAPVKRRAAYFLRAELPQVLGDELRVEQAKAPISEPRNKVDESDLAGVRLVREHALAEKGPSECNPVKTSNELAVLPALYGMAKAHIEKLGVEFADALVDPGRAAASPRGCAAFDNALVVAIEANLELVLLDNAGEPLGNVDVIEGQDSAPLGLDPVKGRVACAFGHGEDAAGIGFEKHLRRDFNGEIGGRSHLLRACLLWLSLAPSI